MIESNECPHGAPNGSGCWRCEYDNDPRVKEGRVLAEAINGGCHAVQCGYCHTVIDPRDPFHVHGHNECLCGATPRHNAYLHNAPLTASEAHSRGMPVLGAAGQFAPAAQATHLKRARKAREK